LLGLALKMTLDDVMSLRP